MINRSVKTLAILTLLQLSISSVGAQPNTAQQTTVGQTQTATGTGINPAGTGSPKQIIRHTPALLKKHLLKPGDAGYERPISKLPSDFPAPLYPGCVFDSANEVDGPARSFYGRFHVAANIDDVAAWYRNTFQTSGWIVAGGEIKKDDVGDIRIVATKTNTHTGCSIRLQKPPDYVLPDKKQKRKKPAPDLTNLGISVTIK